MKISVAMCTYNGERYLSEQLRSIADQTLHPAELVVCDDRSTDRTLALLAAFRETVPFPVRLTRNKTNLGSTQNFAQCIALCNGEAIALCDQDDSWKPEKLAVCASALEQDASVAGVFSNADLIDGHGATLPEALWDRVLFDAEAQRQFSVNPARYLTRRDLVTGAALVFRARERERFLPIASEWIHDGWIAFLLATLSQLRPLPQHLFTYRLHISQQVGLTLVPWQAHLSTKVDLALEAHKYQASRYRQLDERITDLELRGEPIPVEVRQRLRRRVNYEQKRAHLLENPRSKRLMTALSLLPEYSEYNKGFMSFLRDLAHAKPVGVNC